LSVNREGLFIDVDDSDRQVGIIGGRIEALIVVERDEAQPSDEERIGITEQNRPPDQRRHN
jgi:hypothetical protein